MIKIHPTAIVSSNAKIAENVEIGPFCIIGDNVEIKEKTILKSHIVIDGDTKIGENNIIYPFTTIGLAPQDLKFKGEKSRVEIGDNNIIRENVTIHLGTQDDNMVTKIGDHCLLMVGVHIAHDCVLGNHIILANNATLAGHVKIGDNVVIGGLSAVHQFVRIGKGAMIGGMSGVEADVIPYAMVMGERANLAGLNLVGLKRRGIAREEIHDLRNFFKEVFLENDQEFLAKVDIVASQPKSQIVEEVVKFIRDKSDRSFCQVKSKK
jgi:UDP-N-acetylglucosamine acyltransferase